MQAISDIGLLAAFAAGMISFPPPYVLPHVPRYVSFMSGTVAINPEQSAAELPVLPQSLFLLGFSSVFAVQGATTVPPPERPPPPVSLPEPSWQPSMSLLPW